MNDQTNNILLEVSNQHQSTSIDINDINIAEPQAKRFKSNPNPNILELINHHCFEHICRYLNIIDLTNLAGTCKRLHEFANYLLIPRMAKQVKIRVRDGISMDQYNLTYLQDYFEIFGGIVEKLTLTSELEDLRQYYLESSFKTILALCPNLKSLCIANVGFVSNDADILFNATRNLRELKLIDCLEITNDWSEALKDLPKLKKITLSGQNEIDADFFMHTNKLISLTIDFTSCSEIETLEMIFDQNGQSIKQLTLLNFYPLCDEYLSITKLIIDKLPRLKNLALENDIDDELADSLATLPHLKTLTVFACNEKVNDMLRKICEIKTIENLNINNGFYDTNDRNARPLHFKKLRSFRFSSYHSSFEFLNELTRSMMPVITSFDFDFKEHSVIGLLELFESKSTLKSMIIRSMAVEDRFPLIHGIIKIVQPIAWTRTRFYLDFYSGSLRYDNHGFNAEEVSNKVCR